MYDNPDDWFNLNGKKTKKSKGSAGGSTPIIIRNSGGGSPKAQTAKAINAINKKLPQVVVKISGSSKGMDKAQAHANYIGRHGEIEIESHEGDVFKGKDEQKNLLESWAAMGIHETDKTGTRKEALHIVFSMPSGTNPVGLKNAVRNLIAEEFDGHKYFMAQHLDTDSPHVHVLLSVADDRGARLNPRKADLQNYRIQFVNKLAEQGIEATASRRLHRMKYQEGQTQAQVHKQARTGEIKTKKPIGKDSRSKIEKTHQEIKSYYKQYANNLTDGDYATKAEIEKLLKSKEKDKGRD